MQTNLPKTVYLNDYQAPTFFITKAELTFDLRQSETYVDTTLTIQRNGQHQLPLILDGEKLELLEIHLNEAKLPQTSYRLNPDSLIIDSVPNRFIMRTKVKIYPSHNTELKGLYLSKQIYCTQCEPNGFRCITFFIDRPDVMTQFTTTIIANRHHYPILLSNGNLTVQQMIDKENHLVTWSDPSLKSCYLFALVAGDLEEISDKFITKSGREVSLKAYTEQGQINKAYHALKSLRKAMAWEETKFGLEYDLDIYMLVAINDFNVGAMENKGLNVFNSKCMLAATETATDDDYLRIENVVAHEYFHNWSGNRITCRDWFQIALKEGLTTFRDQIFAADVTSPAIQRIKDANFMRTWQFAEDASPTSHPVQPKSYIEIDNFYTFTVYQKGAEIIRMLNLLLGEEAFHRGLLYFFQQLDGKAATIEDFLACMQNNSKVDLTLFKNWYDEKGTPTIEINKLYDETSQTLTIEIKQDRNRHLPLVVGILGKETTQEISTQILPITQQKQRFIFKNIPSPPVLSLSRGFSAPIKINDQPSLDDLLFLYNYDTDAVNRWTAGQVLISKIVFKTLEQKPDEALALLQKVTIVIKNILTDLKLDHAYCAHLITLPQATYLMNMMEVIDVEGIHHNLVKITHHLADTLQKNFLEIYNTLNNNDPYSIDFPAICKRRLKNLSLYYLTQLAKKEYLDLSVSQYHQATNMTDTIGSLKALVNIDCEERTTLFNDFYRKWQHEDLVINKWLELQAMSSLPNTLNTIQELMQTSAFQITNPNKVYALLNTFGQFNHINFHRRDGAGYIFLADQIIKLDQINPHVAARLVEPLLDFKRFSEPNCKLMLDQLHKIYQLPDLSKNLYEKLNKAIT